MRGLCPRIIERFTAQGAVIVGNTPDEFGAYLRSELDKWARVIKEAGIEPVR